MSQENVERLRRSYDAFNLTEQVDLDLFAADVEYIQTAEVGTGETVFHGREGVARAVGELTDAFEGFRVVPERFFDLGDRVLAFVRLRGRAKRGGVPIDAAFAHVATFRGARVTHWHAYAHRDEAVEAVGLPQERMSQGNVDVVLDGYARYNAGERTVEASFWHQDAEYRSAREDPESATYRGIDAIRQQFDRWHEAYPDLQAEIQEVKANGAHVFLWVRLTGHGAASGVPIDMQMAHVCTVRDGKVARLVEYLDRAEALDAVGLRE